MNILVSVNDQYIMPLIVMLTSLFENCRCSVSLWFISKSTSEKAIQTVSEFVTSKAGDFHILKIADDFFSGMPTASYISEETYYRLLCAELLPVELDRILWLDADMVVTKNLEDFYYMPLSDFALAGNAFSGPCFVTESAHYESLGFSSFEYINAGVLLINLQKWRKTDMRLKIKDIVSKGQELKYADQDLLNLIFRNKISCISEKYNFRIRKNRSEKDIEWGKENAAIVHYSGKMKPWMFYDLPLGELWFQYYMKSPYSVQKLHRISMKSLSMMVTKRKQENENN